MLPEAALGSEEGTWETVRTLLQEGQTVSWLVGWFWGCRWGVGEWRSGGGRCVVGLGDLQSSISGACLALRVSQQRRTKCLKVRGFPRPNSQNIGPAGVRLIRSRTSQGLKHLQSSEAAQVQEL